MKEILEKIREEYIINTSKCKVGNTYKTNGEDCFGICYIANRLGSYYLFQEYLEKYKKTRKVFYTCTGEKTSYNDQFLWHPLNIQSRLDWLDKQILKLTNQ